VEPASVGIILDSSVIIAAERRGHTVREILEQLKAIQGESEIGVSVVTIAELVRGAYRTKTQVQQQRRLEFIERLSSDVPVHRSARHCAAGRAYRRPAGSDWCPVCVRGFADRRDSVASRLRSRDAEPPGFPENPGPFRNPTLNDRPPMKIALRSCRRQGAGPLTRLQMPRPLHGTIIYDASQLFLPFS